MFYREDHDKLGEVIMSKQRNITNSDDNNNLYLIKHSY